MAVQRVSDIPQSSSLVSFVSPGKRVWKSMRERILARGGSELSLQDFKPVEKSPTMVEARMAFVVEDLGPNSVQDV